MPLQRWIELACDPRVPCVANVAYCHEPKPCWQCRRAALVIAQAFAILAACHGQLICPLPSSAPL